MAFFRETVDSIVGEFNSIHKRLIAHADRKADEAFRHREVMENYRSKAIAAETEQNRARNVAKKIGELIA